MSQILLPFSIAVSVPLVYFWPRIVRPIRELRSTIDQVGVAFIFLALGSLQVAQHFLFMSACVELVPGAPINVGSSLLFPLSLAVLLYLFIAHRRATFRSVCIYLLSINGCIASLTCIARLDEAGKLFPSAIRQLCTRESTYAVIGGTGLFVIDVVIMVCTYRITKARIKSPFLRIATPLLFAILFDSMGFSDIVAWFTQSGYFAVMIPHVACKAAMGLGYAFCLFLHFVCHDRALIDDTEPEHPIAFLSSVTGFDRFFAASDAILTRAMPHDSVRTRANQPQSEMENRMRYEGMFPVMLSSLKTPRAVKELVDALSPRPARREFEETTFKLSFYFGGNNVAYRRTGRELEILAAGAPKEVAEVIDRLSEEELRNVIIDCPESLKEFLREFRHAPPLRGK